MVEGFSIMKATAESSFEPVQCWQKVSGECISADKRHVLKENFRHSVTLLSAKIPREKVQIVSKLLRPILFDVRGKQYVKDPEDDKKKLLLFDPMKTSRIDELLSEKAKETLREEGIVLPPTAKYRMEVTYEMYSLEDALRVVLPESMQVSGYTVIGHIAHLNLTKEVLPYKFVIGELVLEKNPNRIRTVVNKIHNIDNTFRNFQMELLAGEEDFIATLKENGCNFQLDFSKVYWNSRLSTEHERVVNQLASDDVLYDLFAGVGPYAIPAAAKRGCTVLANDLNPESYRWLRQNAVKNGSKRRKLSIQCYNLDARDFVRNVLRFDYQRRVVNSDLTGRIFVVMNLPALAVEFLDVFRELFDRKFVEEELSGDWSRLYPLHIRCYCFLRDEVDSKQTEHADDMTRSTVEEVTLKHLGLNSFQNLNVRFVRNVAVSKNMFCLEFTVTQKEFMQFDDKGENGDEFPSSKRLKLNSEGD